jgi:protein-S-isoprenylcysteine O-methyltransferase Ste14
MVNRICHFFYELVLLLFFCVLLLAPLHLFATRHYNIDKLIDASSVSFTAHDTSFLQIGDSFPVYRFNPDWTSEIGWIKIASIKDNEVAASFDPDSFSWPMGRQGRVLDVNDNKIKISMGSQWSLKSGDLLCLFSERKLVGKIVLEKVDYNSSWGRIVFILPGEYLKDLTVSEFLFVTQAAILKNPFLLYFDILLFLLAFFLHCYFFIVRRQSLFLLIGSWMRLKYQRLPRELMLYTLNIVLGIPFVWFIINFFPRCIIYLANLLISILTSTVHLSINIPDISFWLNENIKSLYLIGLGIYISAFIWKKSSPILLFWEIFSFRIKENKIVSGVFRDVFIWFLHIIIFYAFGKTLWGFLRGNVSAIFSIVGPGPYWPFAKHLTVYECFTVLRYFLWSITILGCLFGYWYSILGYLFGKRIRNLDFTIMGWMTNAICYGPLLGVIIWQITPSLKGADPIVTPGPLQYMVLLIEFLLNLLYTITIWNLGTMFGVMTDKGVRTSGFYSVVRHPSYTLEALMFVLVFLNGLSTHYQWLAVSMFIFTYYVRSEREDQFMSFSNPEYKVYQKSTPYKFIPGIY